MTVLLSKKDKLEIIDLLKKVDTKKLDIEHKDERVVKWFRFGGFTGLRIACEIIMSLPEKPSAKSKVKVS
jgi:hypothetical protein